MVKWAMVLMALVSLPMPAAAQPQAPALPSLSSPDGLQAHLLQIMTLQQAQVQASLQASRPALDTTQACYYEDKAYSEGAIWTNPKGQSLRCQRDTTNAFSASTQAMQLSWVPHR